MNFSFKSVKTQLIIYLACFVSFLVLKDKDAVLLRTVFITVAAAAFVEALILRLKSGLFQITESATITGLITGCVLSGDEVWWKLCLASILAIVSKHLIRGQKKHIFNPAALGIFLAILIFGVSTEWKGTYLWYIIVPCGIYFAARIKKTEVVIGYAVVSLILFGVQALWQKTNLWNIFGYFSYFYIFVMVIEPKTTPLKPAGKYIFGLALGVLIFVLTQAGVRFDAELAGLLVMNAMVPLLNKVSLKRGGAL